MGCLRDGIVPAGAERMASSNAPHGQPCSARRAMLADRLDRIGGATRKITTRGRQQLTHAHLVSANGKNEYGAHELLLPLRPLIGLLLRPEFPNGSNQPGTEAFDLGAQISE
jgi:hypothetical protein